MPSQILETVYEDQEMTQFQPDEQPGEESHQLEGGQGGDQIEGISRTKSINPSVVSEPPHLGGADPRTLSNVLESQIDRSESGSELG